MTRIFFRAGFLLSLPLVCAAAVLGQTATPTPATTHAAAAAPPPLEAILSRATEQVEKYQETFKNLLAEERKTFEKFDRDGQVKEQTVVESTLLVYQSPRDDKFASELRNVTSVNGKPVSDSQQRSERFLAELQKTVTTEKELEKLRKESARHDKTLEIFGLTVWEAVALTENLRPFFDFQFEGTETHNGRGVYVVGYRQTRKSPFISVNDKNVDTSQPNLWFRLGGVPGALKKNEAFLRGKLWIDAESFQLWREQRELVVRDEPEPHVLLETNFEYQPSDYGILLPKQISYVSNEIKKTADRYAAVKDLRVKFDYSKFRKTETDVKIIDEDQ